ncbi:MAG: MFS transporter, partial [Planctomycetaceae bacterium]
GEAFRTGSHKAIILDYLDSTAKAASSTQVIGRTRSLSKFTSATAAILAGLVLFWLRDYELLFFLSAAASVGGFLLMLSYPRELERSRQREHGRQTSTEDQPAQHRLHQLGRHRRFWALIVQSVLFESQVKIVLKYYLQPFLKTGLGLYGIAIAAPKTVSGIAGSGAVWVGLNEFVRDSLGGLGARMSPRFETMVGNRTAGLNRISLGGLAIVLGVALCSLDLRKGLVPGLLLLVGLTILQNLRRPMFVSAFNEVMESSRRATALSLESVARAVTVAALLPLFGLAADAFGLTSVWILSAGILLVGFLLHPNPRRAVDGT